MCAMHRGTTLVHTVDALDLSHDDVQALLQHLEKKLATAPQSVPCDCLPDDCEGSCDA